MENIWILNHAAITPNYPGGTRHYELGKFFSEEGHRVVIFASSVLHQFPERNTLNSNEKYKIKSVNPNFQFIWISTPTYVKNNWKRFLNMLAYSIKTYYYGRNLVKNKILDSPSIVVGSTVHPFAPITAKLLAGNFKAHYFFEIRDLWPQSLIDMGTWSKKSLISLFFKFIEKISIKNSQAIIYLSPKTKDYLIGNYVLTNKKLCYIPNGTNVALFRSLKIKQNAHRILDSNYFNFVFTGSIIQSNRIDLICEAAKRISDYPKIRINLIGDGNEKRSLMKRYDELNNINWINSVPKSDIPLVLFHADALILIQANVAWGSSNKLYDYLAAGKPIISCVWVSHNDFIGQIGVGIRVEPENVEQLASTFLKIYELPESERLKMGEKAQEYVSNNHDWKLLSTKFLELFDELK